MHWNQQVILPLLFYQASHEGRIYSLPKLQKSRRVTVSRTVCFGLKTRQDLRRGKIDDTLPLWLVLPYIQSNDDTLYYPSFFFFFFFDPLRLPRRLPHCKRS